MKPCRCEESSKWSCNRDGVDQACGCACHSSAVRAGVGFDEWWANVGVMVLAEDQRDAAKSGWDGRTAIPPVPAGAPGLVDDMEDAAAYLSYRGLNVIAEKLRAHVERLRVAARTGDQESGDAGK